MDDAESRVRASKEKEGCGGLSGAGQLPEDVVSMLYQPDCSMNHMLCRRLGDKYTSVRSNIQDRTHCL